MTSPFLLGDVALDEGLRLKAYPDPLSPRGQAMAMPMSERPRGWETLPGAPWTIGYGHTGPDVHEGLVWSLEQCNDALHHDIEHAKALLDRGLPWWRTINDARQDVLANMCLNLGWDNPKTPKLEGLSGFVNALACIREGHYGAAAEHLLDSAWRRQVGARALRLATQMRTGVRVGPK
jgi:lysozyme